MGRVYGSFCPRSSMPEPAPLLETEPDMNVHLSPNATTWQQPADSVVNMGKESKRARGCKFRRQYKKLDLETLHTSFDSNNSWSAQQDWLPPIESSSPPSDKARENSNFPSANKKKHPRHVFLLHQKGNMAPSLTGPYIPPHIRKKAAGAGEAKNESAVHLATPNDSPPNSRQTNKNEKTTLTPEHTLDGHPSVPISPPHTPEDRERLGDTRWLGWAETNVHQQESLKKSNNSKRPRGPKPYKKNVWVKARDIKPLPSESSDGGVQCVSDSHGDPDYDVKKLLDWEGNWMPAPPDWAQRKGFSSRHFGQVIEKWINGHSKQCTIPIDIDMMPVFNTGENDIAPRYWVDGKVEGMNLRDFWNEMPERAPDVLSGIDITEFPPWWDRFEEEGVSCVVPLIVPEANVDMDNPDNFAPRVGLLAAMASAAEKMEAIKNDRIQKERKRRARQNRPVVEPTMPVQEAEDHRLCPTINMYIRPVQPIDVSGIAEIYNYYVKNTTYAHEFDERTSAQIAARINDIVNTGLPYLVAIAKSNRSQGHNSHVNEKIVGFINLNDYCGRSSMYRYTFEMDLFVHPGFVGKGIGKCLLDRLLEISNTGYDPRGGYEYVNNSEYLKTGPMRVIKTIVLNVNHEHGSDMEKIKAYLEPFKFKRCGHITHIGYKRGKVMDVSIFQHHTTETIDPDSVPTVGMSPI